MSSRIDPAAYEDELGTVSSREFGEITRRQVRRYARAVEDDNPLYTDVEFAREQGYDDLVVPPNFLSAVIEPGAGKPADQLRRDGTAPDSIPVTIPEDAMLMGGGQDITVNRYVTAGESITEEETFTDIYQKDAEFGTLTFVERTSEYVADETAPCIECDKTLIVGDTP
jgi:acyl dehydratase